MICKTPRTRTRYDKSIRGQERKRSSQSNQPSVDNRFAHAFEDNRQGLVAWQQLEQSIQESARSRRLGIIQKLADGAPDRRQQCFFGTVNSIPGRQQKFSGGMEARCLQRVIDEDKVERYKGILGLGTVSIIEIPKNDSIKVTTKFSAYPASAIYNLPGGILGKSLLNIEQMKTDKQIKAQEGGKEAYAYYQSTPAFNHLKDFQGGGAYVSPSKLVVICEGESDRALMHEMGHAEQHERLGAKAGGAGTTVNQVILEYHNFILNENQYDLVETNKPIDQIDIRTFYNRSNTGKFKDKSWGNLYSDAKAEFPKNERLLQEIKTVVDSKAYAPWAKKTIANLISEYYVSASKK